MVRPPHLGFLLANPAKGHRLSRCRRPASPCFPAQQQHDGPAGHRVIDAIARSGIDPQFRYPIAQGLVVAEIAEFHAVHAADDSDLAFWIPQLHKPIREWIAAIGSQVVADFEHAHYSSKNECLSISLRSSTSINGPSHI